MKIKKLNNSSNVYSSGNAIWAVSFETTSAYCKAIVLLTEGFGMGSPYTNHPPDDAGHLWLFRNKDVGAYDDQEHRLYIKDKEHLTLLGFSFNPND